MEEAEKMEVQREMAVDSETVEEMEETGVMMVVGSVEVGSGVAVWVRDWAEMVEEERRTDSKHCMHTFR